jgi:hypothetical protein
VVWGSCSKVVSLILKRMKRPEDWNPRGLFWECCTSVESYHMTTFFFLVPFTFRPTVVQCSSLLASSFPLPTNFISPAHPLPLNQNWLAEQGLWGFIRLHLPRPFALEDRPFLSTAGPSTHPNSLLSIILSYSINYSIDLLYYAARLIKQDIFI